jgi:hypothetical protein
MRITRLDPGRAAPPTRVAPATAGFTAVLDQQPDTPPPQSGPVDDILPALASALAQEIAQEPAVRDRRARQHGADMLDELARLQSCLLGGSSGPHRRQLEDLAQRRPTAADPALEEALQAIALRAAVELAKLP